MSTLRSFLLFPASAVGNRLLGRFLRDRMICVVLHVARSFSLGGSAEHSPALPLPPPLIFPRSSRPDRAIIRAVLRTSRTWEYSSPLLTVEEDFACDVFFLRSLGFSIDLLPRLLIVRSYSLFVLSMRSSVVVTSPFWPTPPFFFPPSQLLSATGGGRHFW